MDADVVVLMNRSDKEPGVIELDVAKNRNGPVGAVKLVYEPQFIALRELHQHAAHWRLRRIFPWH